MLCCAALASLLAPADQPSGFSRRQLGLAPLALALPLPSAHAATVRMEGLRGEGKTRTEFPDFEQTKSGLQYKEYKAGSGSLPKAGDRVLVDWTGVTIGYQGRYFQVTSSAAHGCRLTLRAVWPHRCCVHRLGTRPRVAPLRVTASRTFSPSQ